MCFGLTHSPVCRGDGAEAGLLRWAEGVHFRRFPRRIPGLSPDWPVPRLLQGVHHAEPRHQPVQHDWQHWHSWLVRLCWRDSRWRGGGSGGESTSFMNDLTSLWISHSLVQLCSSPLPLVHIINPTCGVHLKYSIVIIVPSLTNDIWDSGLYYYWKCPLL